jgi:hypothetical protein
MYTVQCRNSHIKKKHIFNSTSDGIGWKIRNKKRKRTRKSFQGSRSSDSSPDHKKRRRRITNPTPTKEEAKEAPSLHFSVMYTSTNACLTVNVEKITNIPVDYRKHSSVFFRLSLQSTNPEMETAQHQSQVARDSLNPQFKENFVFGNLTAEDACTAVLEVHLFVKKYPNPLDKHIGIVQVYMESLDLKPDQPIQCAEKFTLVRRHRSSTFSAVKYVLLCLTLDYEYYDGRLTFPSIL